MDEIHLPTVLFAVQVQSRSEALAFYEGERFRVEKCGTRLRCLHTPATRVEEHMFFRTLIMYSPPYVMTCKCSIVAGTRHYTKVSLVT